MHRPTALLTLCRPAFVAATAAAVAALRGVDSEEIATVTRDNFFRLFTKASPSAG